MTWQSQTFEFVNCYESVLGIYNVKSDSFCAYTGVTNNLARRIAEHKNKTGSVFTKRYNVIKLVFYESFSRILDAIVAEKKIKKGSRKKKIELIEQFNPKWNDLYE